MSRARLTALRVVGFKSFAERTTVEFGPGISAIVGPNGSGKSNLADALRWTLGEAGRSLRTRRSEDVIFAGSSTRRATSMADVTLVLENEDRLLPLDYGQVELGRRLFRSGENEYLLNRQRIRLRDLVEMLDAGNLADNAFLFIGQGMVDQALALRPEERRPLFEEAAGVRRHERRRRQAESDLAEAEANLERVRDVLAELRPQARRLAAQADQLRARRSAGHELAEALLGAARGRWAETAAAAAHSQAALARAHADGDSARAALRSAEEQVERLNRTLAEGTDRERVQRDAVDRRRTRTLELRLESTRLAAEVDALERDRRRIAEERATIAARSAEARLLLAQAPPDRSVEEQLSAEIEQLTGDLARARADRAIGESVADEARRVEATWRDERDRRLRRLTAAQAEVAELEARLPRVSASTQAVLAERDEAEQRLAAATAAAEVGEAEAAQARSALDGAIARHDAARTALAAAEANLAGLRSRAAAIAVDLSAGDDEALDRALRERGGRLATDTLTVDPRLRLALAAALAESAAALVIGEDVLGGLPAGRATLVLADSPPADGHGREEAVGEPVITAARAAGGGPLIEGLLQDVHGHVTRLVARTVWVARLEDALALRRRLPPGWQVVTTAGERLSDQGVLSLGASDRLLRLREEQATLGVAVAAAAAEVDQLHSVASQAAVARVAAEAAAKRARDMRDAALREQRRAEEAERSAQRRAEAAAADKSTLAARLADLNAQRRDLETGLAELDAAAQPSVAAAGDQRSTDALDRQAADLEAARDRLSRQLEIRRTARRAAEEGRRRAEIAIGLDEVRGAELDRQAEDLAGRLAGASTAQEQLFAQLRAATSAELAAAEGLAKLAAAGSGDRARLIQADRRAASARDRVRAAETASRSAEVGALEARLQLEALRETLLVELAAIGPEAMNALGAEATAPATAASVAGQPDDADISADRLAAALDGVLGAWRESVAAPTPPPTAGRIGALRRRFHELGAGNPFAAEEHAEVSARLGTLEAQALDLESAIRSTRQLIDDLNRLIAEQFQATFAALESAFARRFSQLFDGGEAQLSLTAPDDLSATGIEITARPPGKKRQPLQMLSGGERALTAVALLLAMLEVRPVPFCVLDEVDAALDEANIGRFAQALRSLAGQTQFIVITHNRGTIESADALYGVTIGEDAVSRVVSLRLPPVGSNGSGHTGLDATAVEVAR